MLVQYVETYPSRSLHKNFYVPFWCTVEHVLLKNVTVDVMNTSWCKTCPECIKMHHLKEKIQKLSREGGGAPPLPRLQSHWGGGYPLSRSHPYRRRRRLRSSSFGTRTPPPGYAEASLDLSYTVHCKEIRVSLKIRVHPLKLLSHTARQPSQLTTVDR